MSEHPEHQSKQERDEPTCGYRHHPSCQPSDRDLVWHCSQCGLNESAEGYVERMREALEWALQFVEQPDYFPGDGDLQWWKGKLASCHKIAALSDVTKQRKILSDCPELQGAKRNEGEGGGHAQ